MTRDKLNALKRRVIDFKEVSQDMKTLASAINKLPKGQLKKILTEEIKEILRKYGVDV